jgi:hypothetical protein
VTGRTHSDGTVAQMAPCIQQNGISQSGDIFSAGSVASGMEICLARMRRDLSLWASEGRKGGTGRPIDPDQTSRPSRKEKGGAETGRVAFRCLGGRRACTPNEGGSSSLSLRFSSSPSCADVQDAEHSLALGEGVGGRKGPSHLLYSTYVLYIQEGGRTRPRTCL